MTTAEMLASVEAQIRKDIPRLMELKEGCILMKRGTKYSPAYRKIVFTYNDTYYVPSQCFGLKVIEFGKKSIDEKYEIIGHEIMLNDVLEWVKFNAFNVEFQENGDFNLYRELKLSKSIERYDFVNWNLSSPYLKDQSEELINFLYNLKK